MKDGQSFGGRGPRIVQVPCTLAGTIHSNAVHQLGQFSLMVVVSSASQSSMVKELETMRVPGLRSRILGRSCRLMRGSRNIVITVALVRSASNRSPLMKVTLLVTPASCARCFDSSTMSGLNSTPMPVAPRLAAVMTVRPSPEPRSITTSCGVTFARSSIASTVTCGVGTQTTSLPSWPDCGS